MSNKHLIVACVCCGAVIDLLRVQRNPGQNCPTCKAPLDAIALVGVPSLTAGDAEQKLADVRALSEEILEIAGPDETLREFATTHRTAVEGVASPFLSAASVKAPAFTQDQVNAIVERAVKQFAAEAAKLQAEAAAKANPAPAPTTTTTTTTPIDPAGAQT